jgi:SAM-dependent methyltransferase
MAQRDLFSQQSAEYSAFRPSYPAELIDYIVGLAPGRELAWDCATGNGQAAAQLASHFTRVLATDASASQLSAAKAHPRVAYRIAAEDDSGAEDRSVDLVTVAQALHWLDLTRFYGEVRRVLKPGGLIAVWCYGPLEVNEEIDVVLRWFEYERLRPFRAPELDHVRTAYRDIDFPFAGVPAGPFTMTMTATRDQFLGFVRSWSAVASARVAGDDPAADLRARLSVVWPAEEDARTVRFPVGVRLGRQT